MNPGSGRHAQPEPRRGNLTDRYVPLKAAPSAESSAPLADLLPRQPTRYDPLTFPTRRRRRGRGLAVLAALALLAALGAAGWFAYGGTRYATRTSAAGATATPAANRTTAPPRGGHDISSQDRDPKPLTTAEVFPASTVSGYGTGYRVAKLEQSDDCHQAVVGELVPTLDAVGCRRVVRATLLSPDPSYVVTAGIFDVHDAASARQAADGIGTVIERARGRFAGLVAGGPSDALGTAPTRAGWETAGHFLVYCVVAHAGASPASQSTVDRIIRDIVEGYLTGQIIQARAGGHE
jgi:hypothetical protein